ncbi:MAG: cytochrome c biogenesis protein CcdA [Desulfobacterales bacterium]
MLEAFFITANEWLAGGGGLAAAGALVWGMVSVLFSPCHLASIPLIVAYVGGQERALVPRQAAVYAVLFSAGLFLTIALIGAVCAFLGRMLGDIGSWWQSLVGAVLIYVALGMMGIESCAVSGGFLYRLNFRGRGGAFALGLGYGVLSGSCTFGFIAPILAMITVQREPMQGIALILLFGIGHCLPIAVAGSSTAAIRRLLENSAWQGAGNWFRKAAGALIGLLGVYFLLNPIWILWSA